MGMQQQQLNHSAGAPHTQAVPAVAGRCDAFRGRQVAAQGGGWTAPARTGAAPPARCPRPRAAPQGGRALRRGILGGVGLPGGVGGCDGEKRSRRRCADCIVFVAGSKNCRYFICIRNMEGYLCEQSWQWQW